MDDYDDIIKNRIPPPLSGISNEGVRPVDNWIVARNIYSILLKNELIPIVYETLLSIYKDAEELTLLKTPEEIERKFLEHLAEVKVWPLNIVKGETKAVLEKCPWFADLLKGVFVSNVMVLSSAQLNLPNAPAAKLRIQIPQCPEFVQTLYTNVAARFFDRPNVFRSEGLSSDQIFDNIRRAKKEIANAIDDTIVQLIPIRQIISTSMNFQGNNAIIATKPPQRPLPPPTRAYEQQNRKSNRGYEPPQLQKQHQEQPQPVQIQKRAAAEVSQKRNTPPVPALKKAPSDPEKITQKTSAKEVAKHIEEHRASNSVKAPLRQEREKSKHQSHLPPPNLAASSQPTRISFNPEKRDNEKKKDQKQAPPPQSRISFRPSLKEKQEKEHVEEKKRKESMSQRNSNVFVRPSQFKQRTGSNVVKEVLGKLNMESVESDNDYSDRSRSSRSDDSATSSSESSDY